MKKEFLFLFASFLIFGCSQEQSKRVLESPHPLTKDSEKSIELEKITGEHVETYSNGQVKISGMLISDKRAGIWRSFFDNGNKQSQTEYINGLRSGQSIVWFKNGNIRYQGHYEADKKIGNWVFFQKNGQVSKEVNYNKN